MNPNITPELQREQDEIFTQWLSSDEDIDAFDYVIKYASDDLRRFLLREKRRRERYEKLGIIIN